MTNTSGNPATKDVSDKIKISEYKPIIYEIKFGSIYFRAENMKYALDEQIWKVYIKNRIYTATVLKSKEIKWDIKPNSFIMFIFQKFLKKEEYI